jgi:hypothetical protein
MTSSIVVAFRALPPQGAAEAVLAGVRLLTEQAAAMGGRLVTFGASVYSFEFDESSVVDAIELAISVALDSVPDMSFGVGVSEGELARDRDATVGATLVWGPSVARAVALSRTARHGEVLLDPGLSAVRDGELLSQGARSGLHGKERLRALVLDIRHPFRSALAERATAVELSRYIGRPELGELLVPSGALGIVRADPGWGGSRFLQELGSALEPARVLVVAPQSLGEPLGSLRRALVGAVSSGQAPLALGDAGGRTLEALLAGEGLEQASAAELLGEWLAPDAPRDPSGALLIDDADSIDLDTLGVVAEALRLMKDPFRVVLRLGGTEPLPRSLEGFPIAAEVKLGKLGASEAGKVVASCFLGQIDERLAERWAERGDGVPLALVESTYEALESGALVWGDEGVQPRRGRSGARASRSASEWATARLSNLQPGGRLLATALATFGGPAEVADARELVRQQSSLDFDFGAARAQLEAAGWAFKVAPDLLALRTATHRDALLATMSGDERSAWHRAACTVLRRSPRPLAMAARAVHAVLGGDPELAADLGARAAGALRVVGLDESADAFSSLAEERRVDGLLERRLLPPLLAALDDLTGPDGKSLLPSAPPPPPTGQRMAAALKSGDLDAVEAVAERLRIEPGRSGLAERL